MTDKSNEHQSRGTRDRADSLRREIHEHLTSLGFSKNCNGYFLDGDVSKQRVRDLHSAQREGVLQQSRTFVDTYAEGLIKFFANGDQVDPSAIDPELVEVKSDTVEARLFRLACLLWSVPVSRGFGRRLRFLVRDRQNGCLIGLFALGDPVFNLSARDSWIGWNHKDRSERLVHVMDAYIIGAVPPYTYLLGGKLVAALMGCDEVKSAYDRKYIGREAVISHNENRARLVLLTTTSALGRSSIYNRLKVPDGPSFIRIGATKGFGHFQLSGHLFDSLRSYLVEIEHPYATGYEFGMGPNWKIRVARTALEKLGIAGNGVLKHGIEREVYAVPLATNWREILLGHHRNVRSRTLPLAETVSYCLQRWIIPRAERDTRYRDFAKEQIIICLLNGGPGPAW